MYEELRSKVLEGLEAGQYEVAELAKVQAEGLKKQHEEVLCSDLKAGQEECLAKVSEEHEKEMVELEDTWRIKWSEFNAHASAMKAALGTRFQKEHTEVMAKLTEPKAPRWSKTLLEQRQVEQRLSRQERFVEAAAVKEKADTRQQEEQAEWTLKCERSVALAEEQLLSKQRLEYSGLEKRLESSRLEDEAAHRTERQRLQARCRNVKAQMLSQHRIAVTVVEKKPWAHTSFLALSERVAGA